MAEARWVAPVPLSMSAISVATDMFVDVCGMADDPHPAPDGEPITDPYSSVAA